MDYLEVWLRVALLFAGFAVLPQQQAEGEYKEHPGWTAIDFV